jgi:folylpolyglutamate synthase/dihydropteroate synthase
MSFVQENNLVVQEILKIVAEREKIELSEDVVDGIKFVAQPCRFELVENSKNLPIVMDVCHNIDGFTAVF